MDHRRFITFLVCFFAFTFIYQTVIIPKFFPQMARPAAVAEDESGDAKDTPQTLANTDAATQQAGDSEAEADAVAGEPEVHPNRQVTLGSLDSKAGYFLQVELNSKGAAIESVRLADPKFTELDDPSQQVKVLGNSLSTDQTFSTAVSAIDQQLSRYTQTLESVDWQIASSDAEHVTFEYTAPDKTLQVRKVFSISRADLTAQTEAEALRTNSKAFTIDLELTVTNLSSKTVEFGYELQGPVGIVLENVDHTRKYRDIKLEFLGEDDSDVTLTASALGKLYKNNLGRREEDTRENLKQKESWTSAFRYAGVDVQFFAALVAPLDGRTEEERLTKKWIERSYPVFTEENLDDVNRSDVSFRMQSTVQTLQPNGQDDRITHKYGLFVGPKRSTLLDPEPLAADAVLDYGSWFGFIARIMHSLLDTLYGIGLPYVLAIIGLTVLVRGCMFPISRKQAISAARMKELQPKIAELKAKYGDEKEKFAKAQMELWRKNNINPMAGCLPVFIQLPVFIALYSCLNTAVDLRLAKFLWIDNLAAPDSLFQLPMKLPFLGSDFNLLPCITVVLFLIQQKLFMPPPADEQAEMQQKMMNFMTIAMGFMFWHVPAGLCIYFIASSAWGIAERKLLGTGKVAVTANVVDVTDTAAATTAVKKIGNKTTPSNDEPEKPKGLLGKWMALAEEAQKQAEKKNKQPKGKNRKKGR